MTHAQFVAGARARYRAVARAFMLSTALIGASIGAAIGDLPWASFALLALAAVPLVMMRGLMREADRWMRIWHEQLTREAAGLAAEPIEGRA